MAWSRGYPHWRLPVSASTNGKRLGGRDPRHIWPDVARIVEETQPGICFFENVPGHLWLGFVDVRDDLQRMGYGVTAGLFAAAEVGATQRRRRLFILAERAGARLEGPRVDATAIGLPRLRSGTVDGCLGIFPPAPRDPGWRAILLARPDLAPAVKPRVRRMAYGLAARVDRIRQCGNGVVPLQAAYAFASLLACCE